MKIYRNLILDLRTYQPLAEDSYNYDGPLDLVKGENKIFQQQQAGAYSQVGQTSAAQTQFVNTLNGYFGQRFGDQSATFKTLSNSLRPVLRQGTGNFQMGGGGQGTGTGGGGGGGGNRRELNGASKEGEFDPNKLGQFGYDPTMFDPNFGTPQAFYDSEEAALRANAAEQTNSDFGQAGQAFGARAQQLGGFSPGLLSAGLSDIAAQGAASEAAGQRNVSLQGAQNKREDLRLQMGLGEDLQKAKASAYGNATQQRLMELARRRQEALQKRAMGQAAGAASAARAEQAREFNIRMRLAGEQLQSQNFFQGIGALGGVAQGQDPMGYGSLTGGTLGTQGGLWGNLYNTGSQGMVQTRSNPLWGQILGAAVGGGLSALTGGASSMLQFGQGAGSLGSYSQGTMNSTNGWIGE